MRADKFSEAVQEKLQSYVYRLIDPRNGETFYVGVGVGNRIFQHVGEDEKSKDFFNLDYGQDEISEKIDRIRSIRNAKLSVLHVIHRHAMDPKTARVVEAALIDAYPGLTNIQGGHGSGQFGPRSPREIIDFYDLPPVPTNRGDKLLIININAIENLRDRQAVYQQVRWQWRIDPVRAGNADYVLAAVRGVCIGAFVARKWLRATDDSFAFFPMEGEPGRWGFIGESAPSDVWEDYVGDHFKAFADKRMQHNQNPIRYFP